MISPSPSGLSSSEVTKLQAQYGPNTLKLNEGRSLFLEFFEEFKDLMIIILIIATIISFVVGEVRDGTVIALIVLLNAFIGFFQKYRAGKAVEALKSMLAPQARVLRDGEQKIIPAEELVPGDIIILYEGDRIPADARITHANECEVQESILTGESMPVTKSVDITTEESAENMIYMGTIMTHGNAQAVITQIGMLTKFGKIANLTTTTEKDMSPLEKELQHVGIFVGKITLMLTVILTILEVTREHQGFANAILFAASVAVAAVPEGLPTTVTIALAIGVKRLAKKHAIMKQLSSVETLGSTTVIVSDKTGTLTKNEMTVEEFFPMSKDAEKFVSYVCTLCNHAKIITSEAGTKILGDPTEGALLVFAKKLGLSQEKALSEAEIIHELTFDSKRKRMTVIVKIGEKIYALCKGAPDSIFSICDELEKNNLHALQKTNEENAKKALRMIGFAYKELSAQTSVKTTFTIENIEKDMTYLGMVGIIDPPREEVPEAIKLAQKAGITVYIVTGDHGLTAEAIAKKIQLIDETSPYQIFTGAELATITDESLRELFNKKTPIIFARVSPEDKLRVVTLLKQNGEIVAVTGDGVNDAPALKRADIGIAMGISGTDVSREAANMVLADDSFSTIVSAIQEGRTIYQNLKKFLMYMFSSNMGELMVIFVAILFGMEQPLTAITILLINIGTDILPALALGLEPSKQKYMEKPPRDPSKKILRKNFIMRLFFIGFLVGAVSLIAYVIGITEYGRDIAMSMTYATLVVAQMFNAYNARSGRDSAFKEPFSNLYLIAAIIISTGLTIATIQIPFLQTYLGTTALNTTQWLIVVALSSIVLWIEELRKILIRNAPHTT